MIIDKRNNLRGSDDGMYSKLKNNRNIINKRLRKNWGLWPTKKSKLVKEIYEYNLLFKNHSKCNICKKIIQDHKEYRRDDNLCFICGLCSNY